VFNKAAVFEIFPHNFLLLFCLGFVTIFATGADFMQVGGKYFARENFFEEKAGGNRLWSVASFEFVLTAKHRHHASLLCKDA
jgi:hypothetical protein